MLSVSIIAIAPEGSSFLAPTILNFYIPVKQVGTTIKESLMLFLQSISSLKTFLDILENVMENQKDWDYNSQPSKLSLFHVNSLVFCF